MGNIRSSAHFLLVGCISVAEKSDGRTTSIRSSYCICSPTSDRRTSCTTGTSSFSPPAYDEVTKEARNEVGAVVKDGDVKIDINESPPEYAMAIAMSLNENVPKTTADKDPSK